MGGNRKGSEMNTESNTTTKALRPAAEIYESHPRVADGDWERHIQATLDAARAWRESIKAIPCDPASVAWAISKAQHVFDLLVSRDTGPITVVPLSEATWRIEAVAEWWRKRDGENEHDCELTVLVGRGINRDQTRRMQLMRPGDRPCDTIVNGDWGYDEAAMERIREWAESYQGAGDEAAKEQAVAVEREEKLRKWTDHEIVRVGNLVGSPHQYMVRGDAVIPWGWDIEMDPAAMVDAAFALQIPITPWEV